MTAQTTRYDAPGRIAAIIPRPAAEQARKVPVGAATSPSLRGMMIARGLSYRKLSGLTGMTPGHLHDLIAGKGTRADQRRVEQMLRSSEPSFLRHVQQVAVPFLRSRIGVHLCPSVEAGLVPDRRN